MAGAIYFPILLIYFFNFYSFWGEVIETKMDLKTFLPYHFFLAGTEKMALTAVGCQRCHPKSPNFTDPGIQKLQDVGKQTSREVCGDDCNWGAFANKSKCNIIQLYHYI